MPQFFQDNIPLLQRDTGTQISMPATYNGQLARARVAGQGYRWSSALACNLATTGLGGLDTGSLAANTLYHVYLCVSSNIVGLVVSANGPSTGPTGFSQNRYVGRLRTQSGSANVAELAVVNAIVGSGDEIPMPIVGEWQSYTPSAFTGFGTTSGNEFSYRRVGGSMELRGKFVAGTTNATEARITLPTGFTSATSSIQVVGLATSNIGATQSAYTLIEPGANYVTFGRIYLTEVALTKLTGSNFTVSSSTVSLQTTIPIAEWQGLFS